MGSILENLFGQQNLHEDKYLDEIGRINCNRGMLKKDFNKWQKKRLLRIIDDKDLIAEKWAIDSFSESVRFGIKFMIEIFANEEYPN